MAEEGDPPSQNEIPSIRETPKERVPVSCTKAFDSVYYCYSPVHQAREYYITGELDDCRGRLKRFRMCIMSRFRPQAVSEALYEEEETKERGGKEQTNPVWELKEEYVANVQKAEQQERREVDLQREKEAEGEVKWWL